MPAETNIFYTKLRALLTQISIRLYFASIGLGSSQHVEYDVDISIGGDMPAAWSITRRYRQFRDLHRTLAHAYGKNLTQYYNAFVKFGYNIE